MFSFFIALAILIGGYFTYGIFIEKVFGVDVSRKTPAYALRDNVDYLPMPTWKVFLIQFLNIAGLGPIFGAIMGIQYGPAAFLWIALGTIFAGGVHDFFSGVISLRKDGASLPEFIGDQLGLTVKQVMRGFSLILMILVGAVFVINPATLLSLMTSHIAEGVLSVNFWIVIIFIYYMLATLLPIDKIIGNIYPVFGFVLLFMAIGIFSVLLIDNIQYVPEFTSGFQNRYPHPEENPIFPMMFVTIACGAISGFHATQSPLMARCLKNEKHARPIFYGAMISEGIVALIWAAAAIAFFKGDFSSLSTYLTESKSAAPLVNSLSVEWLGTVGGILAILGVIAAPITSGDTALRSARLIVADFLHFSQNKIWRRLTISVPIFLATFVIMMIDYQILWRYFGWCNQTLATFTLWAVAVYLLRENKPYIIALIPAIFMTMVSVTYIILAPEGLNFDNKIAQYISETYNISDIYAIDYAISLIIASVATLTICGFFVNMKNKLKSECFICETLMK